MDNIGMEYIVKKARAEESNIQTNLVILYLLDLENGPHAYDK